MQLVGHRDIVLIAFLFQAVRKGMVDSSGQLEEF